LTNRTNGNGYAEILKDEESLGIFLKNLAKFDQLFCAEMMSGREFSLKMEVHANKGELIHCRVDSTSFDRPHGVEKRVSSKQKRQITKTNL